MKNYSLFLFLFFSVPLFAQVNLSDWLDNEIVKNAQVSFTFKDVKSGKTLVKHQGENLLNPASTIKLLTSLIFLDEYGGDHQYQTIVGYTGKIEKDGTLKGDIVLRGSGDPSFGSARYRNNSMELLFDEVGAFAQKEGITCVDGNIVVDASLFGTDCTPHTWQWNDMGNYYASGVWSVNINENAYKLSFDRSSSSPQVMSIYPFIPKLYFTSELTRGSANSGDQAYIFAAPYQNHAYVRGSIPSGKGSFSIRGAIPDAPFFAGYELLKALENKNIKAQSVHVSYKPINNVQVFWKHEGILASQQVKSALQKSINLYCEAFLKTMGDGDREKGIERIKNYLINTKIIKNKKDVQIADGSGLSQRNYISTNTLVDFLIQYKKENTDINSYLARNGYDGTLKNAFTNRKLKGKIYGKSGSMEGVRAYAGFITTKNNQELAFSIMVNNYTEKSRFVIQHIEQLLEQVVDSY